MDMGFAKGLGVFKEPQMILLGSEVREPQVQDVCSDPWNKLLSGEEREEVIYPLGSWGSPPGGPHGSDGGV